MKIFLFALLSTALCAVGDGTVSQQTYRVNYADPQEIAAIAPLMMPSTNRLTIQTVDRNLIVRGTVEQHIVIRQIVRDLDLPPKNIQVRVQFDTTGQSRQSEFGIEPDGPIVISDGEVHGAIKARFGSRSTAQTENTTQMLVAMDGHSASLRVGERVPYLSWLIEYGGRHGYIRETKIEWKDVGAFLAVEPTIVGPGLIRVRLIPELSGRLADGRQNRIQFTHLATEVVAADGQTIQIGGFSEDKEFSSRFLVGTAPGGQSTRTTITLTPTVLP